jgi:hypothetical protein
MILSPRAVIGPGARGHGISFAVRALVPARGRKTPLGSPQAAGAGCENFSNDLPATWLGGRGRRVIYVLSPPLAATVALSAGRLPWCGCQRACRAARVAGCENSRNLRSIRGRKTPRLSASRRGRKTPLDLRSVHSISPPRRGRLSEPPACAAARPSMAGMLTFTLSAAVACNSRRRDSTVLPMRRAAGVTHHGGGSPTGPMSGHLRSESPGAVPARGRKTPLGSRRRLRQRDGRTRQSPCRATHHTPRYTRYQIEGE